MNAPPAAAPDSGTVPAAAKQTAMDSPFNRYVSGSFCVGMTESQR